MILVAIPVFVLELCPYNHFFFVIAFQQVSHRGGVSYVGILSRYPYVFPVLRHRVARYRTDRDLQIARSDAPAVRDGVNIKRIVFGNRRYQQIAVSFAGKIMLCFPASVIIPARPGSYRPAVVMLPEKSAHTIRHIPAVGFDRCFDRVAL